MNIIELRNYLTIYQLPETTNAWMSSGQHALSALRKLEYYYSCYELECFIETHNETDELNDESICDLVTLIKKRWDRIQNTNSAYTQDTKNPANQLYLQIASDLESQFGISKYEIVMHTIINLSDANIKITDFVLTDDNLDVIDVNGCLEKFKKIGLFYLTNQQRELSETEKDRVINHTVNTNKYYKDVARIHQNNANSKRNALPLRRLHPQSRKSGIDESSEDVSHCCYPDYNENAIFNQLYSDVQACHLLSNSELDLLEILHEISNENEALLVDMILAREGNLHNWMVQTTKFDQLTDMLKTLPEKERFMFLSCTKILDKLLLIDNKPSKPTKLRGLLKFLNKFEDKKSVLDCVNADILSFYKDDKKINDIFNINTVTEVEIVEDDIVFYATESFEVNDQQDDEFEFRYEDFHESKIDGYLEKMVIENQSITSSQSDFDDLDAEERAAKKRKVENEVTGQISTIVSSNYPASFFPARKQPSIETTPDETDIQFLIKARDWYKRSYPLETFHYIEKAILALEKGTYDERYKESQINKLHKLVKDTILLINECTDLRRMKSHYHSDENIQKNFYGWINQGITLVKHIYKQPEISECYISIINDLKEKLSSADEQLRVASSSK